MHIGQVIVSNILIKKRSETSDRKYPGTPGYFFGLETIYNMGMKDEKRLVFVKFGGSVITDKGKEERANSESIKSLARQLRDAKAKEKNLSILIGTGAGSFGHIQVKKYKLEGGIVSEKQKLGFSLVEDSVSRLNQMVVAELLKSNIPVVSVKPSSIFTTESGSVKYFFLDAMLGFINLGITPVLYGDMVYDLLVGGSVLSTDRIFYELANIFSKQNIKIDKVVFCGSTNGVLDRDGKTIERITVKNLPEYSDVFFDNKFVDVTGGMKKKVMTALWISKLGIPCRIIGRDSLESCLIEDKFEGTIIE